MEIDAHKRRDMSVVDIYGSLLTVDMDEEVIVLLWGRISELMVNTELSIYRNFCDNREQTDGVICQTIEGSVWVT